MADLLRCLLSVSEKAANVARVCRQEAALFQLLVQEKTGPEKNKKFVQDFKTLADVVIQEMIRHDVCAKFPELNGFIHGEESNKFENGLGESVTVTVCSDPDSTASLLASVLDGDRTAAALLTAAVHQDLHLRDERAEALQLSIDPAELAVWIDPIDATSQYIAGKEVEDPEQGVCESGLPCALVLIGVYLRRTGQPVMGVINQPFSRREPAGSGWKGQHMWGVSYGDVRVCSVRAARRAAGESVCVVLSCSERAELKEALRSRGPLLFASGAGYKLQCVLRGEADAYVSESGTFRWDVCAADALLRACGGGVCELRAALQGQHTPLTYHRPNTHRHGAEQWANGGIIAYTHTHALHSVTAALKDI